MALTHQQVWTAIDALAGRFGMSASGLAKLAGLDPTSFNRSKRIASDDGRPRWPSTESVAKVLAATGASFSDFAALAEGRDAPPKAVPLLGFAQAGADGYFDDSGFPLGQGWDEIEFPGAAEAAYALEISGDSMAPVYRSGDRIVVKPINAADARRGDRIVLKTAEGEVMAKELVRMTGKTVEVKSLNPDYPPRTVPRKDVTWIARIMWASQ